VYLIFYSLAVQNQLIWRGTREVPEIDIMRLLTLSKRDCPAKFVWLDVVSLNRSLIRGEAPRFSADFTHPLSWKEHL
jgi:hypothetical protein